MSAISPGEGISVNKHLEGQPVKLDNFDYREKRFTIIYISFWLLAYIRRLVMILRDLAKKQKKFLILIDIQANNNIKH